GAGRMPAKDVPCTAPGVSDGAPAFDPTKLVSKCDFDRMQQTSVNGKCVGAAVDSSELPGSSDGQVFGDGGSAERPACFDVARCFEGATPVAGLDAARCSFRLP